MGQDSFQADCVTLDEIEIDGGLVTFIYDIDGDENTFQLEYEAGVGSVFAGLDRDARQSFAASLGVLGLARFGAVIPRRFDITRFGAWVPRQLLDFAMRTLPAKWGEHRYQLDRLDYQRPELIVDHHALASKVSLPLLGVQDPRPNTVMVATGSGKDSLLCEILLRQAGVSFEAFTYLHDLYGDLDHQSEVFGRLRSSASDIPVNKLAIRDDLEGWLRKRMDRDGVTDPVAVDGIPKPFRTEAGEVFTGSFAMVPLQIASGIGTQAFGNERSADFPNIVHPRTGEAIAHQFAKSARAEAMLNDLYRTLFDNVQRVSLTKVIYDVKIFETLFALGGELPYLTNSCNHSKPWCGQCEKCLYVFAGFSAFGDHSATVTAFGRDPFIDPVVVPVWRDLLGLNDRIAWECVGHPDEAQLYLFMALRDGVSGCAIDLFVEEVWKPLVARRGGDDAAERHFAEIYDKYSTVDPRHHHMPAWLGDKVIGVLTSAPPSSKRHRLMGAD